MINELSLENLLQEEKYTTYDMIKDFNTAERLHLDVEVSLEKFIFADTMREKIKDRGFEDYNDIISHESLKDVGNKIWEGVKKFFQSIMRFFRKFIKPFFMKIINFFTNIFKGKDVVKKHSEDKIAVPVEILDKKRSNKTAEYINSMYENSKEIKEMAEDTPDIEKIMSEESVSMMSLSFEHYVSDLDRNQAKIKEISGKLDRSSEIYRIIEEQYSGKTAVVDSKKLLKAIEEREKAIKEFHKLVPQMLNTMDRTQKLFERNIQSVDSYMKRNNLTDKQEMVMTRYRNNLASKIKLIHEFNTQLTSGVRNLTREIKTDWEWIGQSLKGSMSIDALSEKIRSNGGIPEDFNDELREKYDTRDSELMTTLGDMEVITKRYMR